MLQLGGFRRRPRSKRSEPSPHHAPIFGFRHCLSPGRRRGVLVAARALRRRSIAAQRSYGVRATRVIVFGTGKQQGACRSSSSRSSRRKAEEAEDSRWRRRTHYTQRRTDASFSIRVLAEATCRTPRAGSRAGGRRCCRAAAAGYRWRGSALALLLAQPLHWRVIHPPPSSYIAPRSIFSMRSFAWPLFHLKANEIWFTSATTCAGENSGCVCDQWRSSPSGR